jgi:pullulanase/glycogen debranching enzyme
VAEPADTLYCDEVARLSTAVTQCVKSSDAGAHERRGFLRRQLARDTSQGLDWREYELRVPAVVADAKNNRRRPWNSIDFVVAHDGFTLADLYRFNSKNDNQAYPDGPSDGGNDNNISWDQDGNGSDQRKAARNGLSLLMLSAGTPMMTGGDEFLRSLNGNNNPYNLDTEFNWLNYTLNSDQKMFLTFAHRLAAFREAHPALRPVDFYTSEQLIWFKPDGGKADNGYFDNPDNHAIARIVEGKDFRDPARALYTPTTRGRAKCPLSYRRRRRETNGFA